MFSIYFYYYYNFLFLLFFCSCFILRRSGGVKGIIIRGWESKTGVWMLSYFGYFSNLPVKS